MADPQIKTITKGSWQKVATSITTGQMYNRNSGATYYQTYRATGGAAPTTTFADEGVVLNNFAGGIPIDFSASVDLYIWCTVEDGIIRLDV